MWAIIAIPFVDNTKVMKNFPETKKKKTQMKPWVLLGKPTEGTGETPRDH